MTNTVKKPTKKENFNVICSILTVAENAGIALEGNEQITYASLIECMENEIAILDKKAEDAKKRAADRKTEGDILRDKIYEILPVDEFMAVEEIARTVDYPDVTPQKVTARMKQLSDLGKVEKGSVSIPSSVEGGKTRKVSGYRKLA